MENDFKIGDEVLIIGGPACTFKITEVFETSVLTTFGNIHISKNSLVREDDDNYTIIGGNRE